jgi:hypothetical protein
VTRPGIAWGAVALGAMAALAGALLTFLVLGIVGAVGVDHGAVLLILVELAALVVAGYTGGRFGGPPTVVHGSLAALLLSLVTGTLSVAASDAGWGAIVALAIVAAVLGAAGGALAAHSSHRPG